MTMLPRLERISQIPAPPRGWHRAATGGWLLLTLTLLLCACLEEPEDLSSDSGPITERDASGGPQDAASSDAETRDAAATPDASQADAGSSSNGSLDAGDASAMDARTAADANDASAIADANASLDASANTDASDAATQAPDAHVVDAATDGASQPSDAASIYDDNAKWLCRPGLPNSPCLQKLEITDLHADGGTSVSELPHTPAAVAADCLYLYPTVDPGLFAPPRNLDFPQIDRASVEGVFFAQAMPFRGTCALYAPIYRQTSLTSFEQLDTREKGLETAYRDLEAAFDYYLRHAAPGRPIVLIAHSQGAIVMSRLLQRRFEGHPELLARLVVAVLAGPMGGFRVPEGAVVGDTLKQIPLCTATAQTGCVLTYNSFAASAPPNADYTKVNGSVQTGFDTGCTSPPGGDGGSARRLSGALFHAQLSGGLAGLLSPTFDFGSVRVRTRYARYADFYTGRCADSAQGLSYLRITAEPLPGDVRKDPVPYDHLTLSDRALGLHALDYTFVSGDLIQAVQTKLNAHRK